MYELLSPAGDLERFRGAVMYGADAVYLGTEKFSMRAKPPNFTEKTLAEAVSFAHENGVKAYLTCNSLPRNSELNAFEPYIKTAAEIGIDALIIADLGLFSLARKILPDMEIHMSTQTGAVNFQTVKMLYEMGAKRIVLARELNLNEISEIHAKVPEAELEVFVHGSMCVSFSGRCLLSEYMTGRDANRGECAQACRWKYALTEEKRPGEYYPIEEYKEGAYILNSKDLNALPFLEQVLATGVTSLKIEGRAKSAYYVSAVTNAYRVALDALKANKPIPEWVIGETEKVSHRQYSSGFFFGNNQTSTSLTAPINTLSNIQRNYHPNTPGQVYSNGGYERDYDIAAVVTGVKDGRMYCRQRNKILPDTACEIILKGEKYIDYTIGKLYDKNNNEIPDTRHSEMEFSFDYNGKPVQSGSIIRIRGLKSFK
ncbi:MAG: U32 family peptidase [Ruminococcus sp.]|jgi:putative protease|nr:U32 family peptidase [Ruminococcus sp.]